MEKREKSNIILSAAGLSVSRLGSLIYTFAIGLYVLKLTGSGQSFAMTLLLGILPRVILGPIAGNLADRMNKKLLVVGSDVFSGLLMSGLFFYGISGELTLPVIYVATLLLSISAVMLDTAFGAAQRDIVRLESLTKMGSLRHSLESIINLASPMIGGLIYAILPISAFLLINGISFFISALSEMFIDFQFNKEENREIPEKQSFIQDMKSGFSYFKQDKLLIAIAISALMLNFFLSSMSVVIPYTVIEVLGINETLFGLSSSVMSLGALGGAILMGKLNRGLTRSFFLKAAFFLGLFFTLIGVSTNSLFGSGTSVLALITFFAFLTIASATVLNIPIGVFFQTRVEPAYLGRVSSIVGSLVHAVMPLSYIFFGFLTDKVSPFIILTVNGLAFLFIVLMMAKSATFQELDNHAEKAEAMMAAGENA